MLNLERLKGETYVSIVRDFVKRVLVNDDVAIGFFVKNDVKYFLVNLGFRDVESSKSILSSIENVLGEYFMFRRVEGRELELLFSSRRPYFSKVILTLMLPASLLLILYSFYGIITMFFIIFLIYFYSRDLRIYDNFVQLSFTCTKNRLLFIVRDPDSVKSDALHVSRCRCSYLVMFRRCRDLETIARERLHREQESLIVKERGRSYSEVLAWRNVIDRLNYGEEPLIMSINVSSRELEPYFNLHIGDLCYIFDPSRLSVHALTNDIAILIPMHSSSGTVYESSRRIFIGYDRSSREVYIDIDSLPNNHILIVGPTGMGKSWTCKTILTEFVRNNISIIVIDPHGEYGEYFREKFNDILEIKFPESFINIFDISNLTLQDKIYRTFISLCESLSYDVPQHVLDIIDEVYQKYRGLNPVKMINEIINNVDDFLIKLFFRKLFEYYSKCKIVNMNDIVKSRIVIFNFKNILSDVDVLRFIMLMLVDLLYSYLTSLEISRGLRYIIAIDEAYYIINSRIIELCVKGLRKLGVGILLITQSIDGIKSDILQNIGLSIILGGPDPYVESIASQYLLNNDDVLWLSTSLPPSHYRRSTRALLMIGPVKKHVSIVLR
ncbi:MAG: ATP-binding protein [Crenarchaeota archaeon]|nr:ATP-binding protein [Thermoproteota archaeon]